MSKKKQLKLIRKSLAEQLKIREDQRAAERTQAALRSKALEEQKRKLEQGLLAAGIDPQTGRKIDWAARAKNDAARHLVSHNRI